MNSNGKQDFYAYKEITENPIILDFTGCKYLGEIHNVFKTKFVLPELPPIYGACREACRRFGVPVSEEFFENFASDYANL